MSRTLVAIRRLPRRLFADLPTAAVSLSVIALVALALPGFVEWALLDATFSGRPEDCGPGGACWIFIGARLDQFVYGFYPAEERWRVDATFVLLVLTLAPIFFRAFPWKLQLAGAAIFFFPFVAYLLLSGGLFGLSPVPTNLWGGLFVTLLLSLTAMAVSLPAGVLLAIARTSEHPVARPLAAAIVELFRGVPLIAILFMAVVMLPLFMPDEGLLSLFGRVIVGMAIYASAYMAEVMRGALASVDKGQDEAAKALGLGWWQRLRLVVLPQAFRVAIPNIVNTFVQLVKDSTLVLIIGVFDLLGMVQVAVTDPQWLGRSVEGYLFAGAVFFVLCFGMSAYSRRLERQLGADGERGR